MRNRSAILRLFAAHAISSFAQGISMMAIPWYFASVMGQAQLFARIVAVATFVSLLWSMVAGSFIDRYPRRSVFLVINSVGFIVLCGMALYGHRVGEVPPWGIAAVFVFTFFLYNIHYPALYAFTQEMTESRDFGRVNSTIEVLGQSTSVLSGAIGAMLIAGLSDGHVNMMGADLHLPFRFGAWHMYEIFLLDGATYGISLIILYTLRFETVHALETDLEPIGQRIRNGFRYLWSRPRVLLFGTMSYMVFVVLMVEVLLLLAMYVSGHLGAAADVYASSEVYYSIGALCAGLGVRQLMRGMGPVRGVLLLMLAVGSLFVAAGLTRSVWFFFLFSLLIGFGNAGVRVLRVTWLFNHIPNNIIGRCTSIFHMFNITCRGTLLAVFSLAWFARADHVRWAYVICGCAVLVAMVPIVAYLKELEEMG